MSNGFGFGFGKAGDVRKRNRIHHSTSRPRCRKWNHSMLRWGGCRREIEMGEGGGSMFLDLL